MPRKPEASFELKKLIWDAAATVGKDKYANIVRQIEHQQWKLKETNPFLSHEEIPDVRTIRHIIERDINELSPEVVKVKLPPHVWKLRNDYETLVPSDKLSGKLDATFQKRPPKIPPRLKYISSQSEHLRQIVSLVRELIWEIERSQFGRHFRESYELRECLPYVLPHFPGSALRDNYESWKNLTKEYRQLWDTVSIKILGRCSQETKRQINWDWVEKLDSCDRPFADSVLGYTIGARQGLYSAQLNDENYKVHVFESNVHRRHCYRLHFTPKFSQEIYQDKRLVYMCLECKLYGEVDEKGNKGIIFQSIPFPYSHPHSDCEWLTAKPDTSKLRRPPLLDDWFNSTPIAECSQELTVGEFQKAHVLLLQEFYQSNDMMRMAELATTLSRLQTQICQELRNSLNTGVYISCTCELSDSTPRC
jgi:hypothetical protein